MAYECRIYDGKGKLKKVHHVKDIKSTSADKLLKQKSTRKARRFVENFKQGGNAPSRSGTFHEKQCCQCGNPFHARHKAAKYCSHECQKKFYYEKRKKDRQTMK